MKRYGDVPIRGQSYIHRPGAYAILQRGADLLLTWQGAPNNEIQLPGGGVDPGESPLQALNREVFEETGWRITRPRLVGIYRRFAYMPEYDMHAEKVCHIYHARPVLALGPATEDGHFALWLPVELALTKLANVGDADVVARCFGLKHR